MNRRAGSESGFLLVGVIMFVLALTILGMSLYSLSSYEADFQMKSRDSKLALYEAQSGLAMVQAMLTRTDSLGSAHAVIGHREIVWAVAMQHRPNNAGWDSLGLVRPDSTVWVTVVTDRHEQSHTVTARFLPNRLNNYYKRLLTVANQIKIENGTGGSNANTVVLTGDVWQGGSDHSWTAQCNPAKNPWTHPDPLRTDALSSPDLADYFATHLPSASTATVGLLNPSDPNIEKLDLVAVGPDPVFFTVTNPLDLQNQPLGLYVAKQIYITVSGTAVCLLPHGVNFYQSVNVQHPPGVGGVLVLVADHGSDPDVPDLSMWFQGGIQDDGVPLILASAGTITLEAAQGYFNAPNYVYDLSVYTANMTMMGPENAYPVTMNLSYDPTVMNAVLDAIPSGCLPQPAGYTTSAFTFVRGSWRDLTP